MGGVQNFTMSCLALHAMQEYGVTMQVEEDKARIAISRGWPVSKDDLRSLKEDIELPIFQISEKQRRLELKDRWKSHYNELTGRSVDGDETDLFYQYLDEDRFIVDGNDVYLDTSALAMDSPASTPSTATVRLRCALASSLASSYCMGYPSVCLTSPADSSVTLALCTLVTLS